jgi:tetratricopeptide (TPR) repeat protein
MYRDALAACEQGRVADGVAILEQARALAPGEPSIHVLLGQALTHLGRHEEALTNFDRALALGASSAGLHGNRADTLAALGRREEAVEGYDRALAIKPDALNEWCNRGATLHELGRYEQAAESFSRAAALAPDFAPAHYNRGNALVALKRYEAALASLDRALALAPGSADAHNSRANALDQLGRQAEALAAVERALAIEPGHRAALVTRAVILRKLGRAEEALATCDRALALAEDTEALTVRADVLIDLERFDEAIAACDRVIANDPAGVGAKWNKSLLCLGLGRFKEGWPLYEHRWAGTKGLVPRPYHQPRWNGGRVDGPLLIWSEQGIGDEILHSCMIEDVLARTDEVVIEAEPRLQALFRRSFPRVKVIPFSDALYRGPVSAQIGMGSLGALFRTSWNDFPRRDRGHLVPDMARAQGYRARLAPDGKALIGLTWHSRAATGKAKSTTLPEIAGLLRLPGCRFVDLQYGDTRAEREMAERELGVRVEHLDDVDNMRDIDGLAALIAACDCVVAVSNVTAHLAGAVGQRTWVMVPRGGGRLWFWFHQGEDSPWYPRVHVRRQKPAQSWTNLVASFTGEVAAHVADRSRNNG